MHTQKTQAHMKANNTHSTLVSDSSQNSYSEWCVTVHLPRQDNMLLHIRAIIPRKIGYSIISSFVFETFEPNKHWSMLMSVRAIKPDLHSFVWWGINPPFNV